MVDEFAAKGFPLQGQSIRNHLMKAWHGHLKALLSEANWKESKSIPSEEDYMSFAEVTAGLEAGITQTRYFLGSELSEEAVSSREYSNLLKHVSVITRLLNDLASDEREIAEGKLHSVSLRAIHGAITTEEAVKEIRKLIDSHRRELLKMVLQTKGSVVPKACKDLIWKANKVVGFVYNMDTDGYSHMAEMIDAVNAVIFEPVIMPPSNKKDKFSA
ncbi:Ent-kaurene synthase [Quillaja saponaria]|uniref:Ent-kaurene synthase n=1 Tax=Quillaja saponaria TaxID=32244 RepID=A0AAD7PVG7_QUISA|nr:Ent-kaurene synthase [Quillaja saponaria]